MKLHIITPCSRPGWLIPAFRSIEEAVRKANIECTWTLIVTPEERKQFPEMWLGGWVELFVCSPHTEGAICEKKLNEFVFNSQIDSETFLWIFSDDNLLPVNVLQMINQAIVYSAKPEEIDMVVVSHKRGQRNDLHGCWDLVADPDEMKFCYTSGEQVFFKRKYYIHWVESNHGDGLFIEHLKATVPEHKALYLPDVWTTFDGQKAARWDKEKIEDLVFNKGGIDL